MSFSNSANASPATRPVKLLLFFLIILKTTIGFGQEHTYITSNTWESCCKWKFTEGTPFDPKQVAPGDTIFVEFGSLRQFRKIARKIKNPFILISANQDRPLPDDNRKLLKIKNLATWFVQNIDCPPSDKVQPLPIGIPNTFEPNGGFKVAETKKRDIFVYVNFNISTNSKERQPCWDYFAKKEWTHLTSGRSYQDYLEDLSRSVFTISPPGNGLDCYRTWEALYLKCYPIVLGTTLNPLYEDLPVLVVNSWAEVTEEFLKKKKEEFDQREWSYEKAYSPYWLGKIGTLQQQIKTASHNSSGSERRSQ